MLAPEEAQEIRLPSKALMAAHAIEDIHHGIVVGPKSATSITGYVTEADVSLEVRRELMNARIR